MANEEHLKILKQGVEAWNEWRKQNAVIPDLSEISLIGADFRRADLKWVNFREANLSEVDFKSANLTSANMRGAKLTGANFNNTNMYVVSLAEAALTNASFNGVDLLGASLSNADLHEASFNETYFNGTHLNGANFDHATLGFSVFVNIDFRTVKGLETIYHLGPSFIDINSLYLSGGNIPKVFLRGCGVPNEFIAYIPSLIGAQEAIQFYSCFISYSSKDEEFCKRLHARMRAEHLRVWFAPEDVKGGEKLGEQIDRAIQMHDRLLIVLSEESLKSKWVMTEIRRARKTELREGRRKLFPIRLCSYEQLRDWECLDADSGEDLAVEVRGYFIPDFSNWKDHDAFESAFDRLLKDLRAAEVGGKEGSQNTA